MNHRLHTKYCSDIRNRIAGWKKAQDDALEEQKYNPFSSQYCAKHQLSKDDPEYGTPMKGTKTYARGKKAARIVSKEMTDLCDIIYQTGAKLRDGSIGIKFGRLWATYLGISDKVVGMLIRARRHGYVYFPGEMLYQRQDDDTTIQLIKLPECLAEEYGQITMHDIYGQPFIPEIYKTYVENDYESDKEEESHAEANGVTQSKPDANP